MAAGTAFTLLIRGTVVKGSGTAITNFAVVTSDTPDPDLSNNTDESITDIIDSISADISVTKSADPSTAVIGDFITYKITVTNYGPNTAENTVLYDELSESLSDAEFSVDGGAAWNRWANSYSIGELAPGGNVTVLIRAVVLSDECGRICNTASVTSSTPDINLDNNSYCLSTPVLRGADLSITKTACLSRTDCSLCINYTLVVCNCGPEKARHIVITDKLPAEVCNPVYSVDNGNTWCPWSGRFTVLELEVDECICILIQGRINPCATGSIDNTAKVVSATPDPNLCNNRDSVRVKLK